MSTTTTKEQHINELLIKIDGKPTGTKDNPIPYGYPGLSFEDAVELRILICDVDRKQAEKAIEDIRAPIWIE